MMEVGVGCGVVTYLGSIRYGVRDCNTVGTAILPERKGKLRYVDLEDKDRGRVGEGRNEIKNTITVPRWTWHHKKGLPCLWDGR